MIQSLYIDIILPLALPRQYTYLVPVEFQEKIRIGQRVVVQFGKKKYYSAIVYKIHNSKPENYEIKEILSLLDEKPIVNDLQLKLWEWISEYYMCTLGEVYKAAVPSAFKLESETNIFRNSEFNENLELTEKEEIILQRLLLKESMSVLEINNLLDIKNSFPLINLLLNKKLISVEENLKNTYKPKTKTYIKLCAAYSDKDLLDTVTEKLKRAKLQEEILLKFLDISNTFQSDLPRQISKKELLKNFEGNDQALRGLINKGILEEYEVEISRLEKYSGNTNAQAPLTSDQQKAYEQVSENLKSADTVLLHGITSSGKTEIYIQLIQDYIEQGKQVLYLLPEIALTTQIIVRLKNIFGDQVGVYHSKYSAAERVEIWNSVSGQDLSHNYKIILGARSSVFLPFSNLGLVIVDEEHDGSYKQFDPAPRYHARDTAIVLAKSHSAKILLGTATPSIESFYNAKSGKYALVELNSRYQNIELPRIIIADIRESLRKKTMHSHFTPLLIKYVKEALDNKEQVILFQNRRGFSPYMECNACGWIPKCKACNVSLTYHKHLNKLVCHYCGYYHNIFKECKECTSNEVFTKGFGTEKIEEEIAVFFPDARIARMDLDTTRSRKGYEKIIFDFEEHETDILIGTQMITKGLDFGNVSVVGILDAGNMLHMPDFRAFEKGFQMITQVSGRAGRKNKRGNVVLQTYDPKHPVIQDILRDDFFEFYQSQITERKNFHYPPFCRLLKISVKHRKEEITDTATAKLTNELRKIFGEKVLGPETPLVNKIQNLFLKNILVKLEKDKSLSQSKKNILNAINNLRLIEAYKYIDVVLDIDPV